MELQLVAFGVLLGEPPLGVEPPLPVEPPPPVLVVGIVPPVRLQTQ